MSLKFIIMTLIGFSVNALAADSSHAPSHSGSAAEVAASIDTRVSRHYVQDWQAFPSMSLRDMSSGAPLQRESPKGRVTIIVFLASWCLPCQQLMGPLKALESKYKDRYTDVLYVFAHDTEADAEGFSKFHKLEGRSYLGTAKLLETFHQPELPTVYVSDRYGWLLTRSLQSKASDLNTIDEILDLHTSL